METDPLISALVQGDEAAAVKIINDMSNDDINQPMPGLRRTVFGLVVRWGSVDLARRLLRDRAADVSARDETGSVPLHAACERDDPAMVQLLLDAGADTTLSTEDSSVGAPMAIAVTCGHSAVVSLLLRRGPPLSKWNAFIYLVMACRSGFDDIVIELLPLWKPETTNVTGDSALSGAATHGHLEITRVLLDTLISTDQASSRFLNGALVGAIAGYNADVANLAIIKGADVNDVIYPKKNFTALMIAAHYGGPTVAEIMKKRPDNINATDIRGYTALYIAIRAANIQAVELILEAADPNIPDSQGRTPLNIAAMRGHEAVVSMLLQHESTLIDLADRDGFTPLMKAARHGHSAVVKLLIRRGADTQLLTKNGNRALDLARGLDHVPIINMLEYPVVQVIPRSMILAELIYPPRSSWPIASVQFLGHCYYGDSFKDYPDKWGYQLYNIRSDWFASRLRNPERFIAFLQSWLIFGLATEVLRTAMKAYPPSIEDQRTSIHHNRRKFFEVDLRAIVISGMIEPRLPEKYCREWRLEAGLTNLPDQEWRRRANDIKEMLQIACDVCERLDVMNRNAAWPLNGEAWASNILFFSIFGQYLTNLASDVYSANREDRLDASWPEWRLTAALRQTMLIKGWCLASITDLSSEFRVDTLYLIAQDQPMKDHSQCRGEKCAAYDGADVTEYHIKHVDLDNCCTSVGRSDATTAEILRRNEIPVIPLDVADEPRSGVEGRDARLISTSITGEDRPVNYTIVLHTCSDSLGNPLGNKIPYCQLVRIVHLCKMQDSQAKAFWLDTLCVPGDPPLRNIAIGRMDKVYSQASSIIVLDGALMAIQPPPLPTLVDELAREEFALRSLARITATGWPRRLRTLYEDINTSRMSFALGDTIVRWEELLKYSEYPQYHRESSLELDCRQMAWFVD